MSDAWGWPQWFMAATYALVFVCAIAVDGDPRRGTHNGALIIVFQAVFIFVLWCGGFWS